MKYYLSNGIIEIEVNSRGAELTSLRKVTSPYEYLWQGNPEYWNRHAPILFPNVGKVWQDTAHLDGAPLTLHQHGFARDCEFQLVAEEDRYLAFRLTSDDQTRSLFPRDFELTIGYRLLRNVLTVEWSVLNTGQQMMPFQIGAHPGFNYPHYKADADIHGYFDFDAEGPLTSLAVSGGFATGKSFDVELEDGCRLPLGNNTFDCDTIIEATGRVHRIAMLDAEARPYITVLHQMPITALWSPAGGRAPFVCIEPWHGRCDDTGFAGEFDRRPGVQHVQPGWTWDESYQIIVE